MSAGMFLPRRWAGSESGFAGSRIEVASDRTKGKRCKRGPTGPCGDKGERAEPVTIVNW
jgi:hypothetical protein